MKCSNVAINVISRSRLFRKLNASSLSYLSLIFQINKLSRHSATMRMIFPTFILSLLLMCISACANDVPPDVTGQIFFRNFVHPGKPVLIKSLLSGMSFQYKISLKRESLKETGLAAVTVYSGRVLSDLIENGSEFKESLHFNLKTR